MARVSACAAVFNGAETLAAALESVRAQTVPPDEILVLDDGSTDASAAIAEAHGARVLRQENRGLGEARRRMVAEATGDLVAFIDHDDLWMPEKLERQLQALERSDAVLVHADCWYVYEDGREVARDLALGPHARPFDHIVPNNLVIASSALFDRRAMLDAGNFVADTVRCSDWYGWFLLAGRGAFCHVPEKLVRYQVLSSSLANAGYAFHDAQRHVLEAHVLPRFDDLFAGVPPNARRSYRRALEREVGIAHSSMGKHLARQGNRSEALLHHRRALKLAPGVPRVWTRFLRSLI